MNTRYLSSRTPTSVALTTAVLSAVLLLLAFCSNAFATSVVAKEGSLVSFVADSGDTNNLTVTYDGTAYTFQDAATTVAAGSGCTLLTANSVRCTSAGIDQLEVSLLDQDDTASILQTGFDEFATVFVSAGSGNDTITDGYESATLLGNSGADALSGAGGEDTFIGGSGADDATGGDGFDIFSYDDGARSDGVTVTLDGVVGDGTSGEDDNIHDDFEILIGTEWDDSLTGGPNGGELAGGDGNDALVGGPSADLLVGGAGTDTYVGGEGTNDQISYADHATGVSISPDGLANDGSSGENENVPADIERFTGSPANDNISTGTGDAVVEAGAGDDVVTGLGGNDSIYGGEGNDTLNTGPGDDFVIGSDGNDFIDAGLGDDSMNGGDGTDTLSYASHTNPVSIDLGDQSGEVGEYDYLNAESGFEVLSLSGANDSFYGVNGMGEITRVNGGAGNDVLRGTDDANTLHGDDGNDLIYTYSGNDQAYGDVGDDTIYGSDGNDALYGGDGNDTLSGGRGMDVFYGGRGASDTATYGAGAESPGSAKITIDDIANDGATGQRDNVHYDVENVKGTEYADTIVGSGANNLLSGNGGADKLYGDDGDDRLVGGTAADALNGGNGKDVAVYSDHVAGVTVTLNGLTGDGSTGENDFVKADMESIDGSNFNDTLTGNDSDNDLYGLQGGDIITGNGGADVMYGDVELGQGWCNPIQIGPEEWECLPWPAGNDQLRGGAGNDTISDDGGDDYLEPGRGDDMLWPGPGFDTLDYQTGGLGVGASGYGDVELYDGAAFIGTPVETDEVHQSFMPELAIEKWVLSNQNDTFFSLSSSDSVKLIEAGAGNDNVLTQQASGEVIRGGDGDDRLWDNGSGDNAIYGGAGNDWMGSRKLSGSSPGPGSDAIDGGSGDDTLEGSVDGDVVGGDGSDTFAMSSNIAGSGVTFSLDGLANDGSGAGGTGNVHSDIESYTGSSGADHIDGSPGDDHIDGGGGADVVNGLGGNDWLSGGAGADTVDGGDGADYVSSGNSPTEIDLLFGGDGDDSLNSVDLTTPSAYADTSDCGPGNDTATVDYSHYLPSGTLVRPDIFNANCETILH